MWRPELAFLSFFLCLPEQSVPQERMNPSNPACGRGPLLQEWREAADHRAELLRYLKEQVPRIFCLKTESSPQEEEELMQRRLLYPLECFLFGEDPQEGLEKLKQGSTSSQLCGRVFKEGETVYSCRSELTHWCSGGKNHKKKKKITALITSVDLKHFVPQIGDLNWFYSRSGGTVQHLHCI